MYLVLEMVTVDNFQRFYSRVEDSLDGQEPCVSHELSSHLIAENKVLLNSTALFGSDYWLSSSVQSEISY